jgi:predicted phosphodiesterase
MQIGIVADIHEAIEPLSRALAEFRARSVEVVVNLGDACDTFTPVGRSSAVVALLREAGAVGVWGNHDVGLCSQVSDKVRHDTDPAVLAYMATMRPQLVLEDCRFSHVEPWLDATLVENLWYFDGVPDTPEKAGRSFAAVPEQFLFVGHFHRWLVMTPSGAVPWEGEGHLELREAARYLTVVAPVVSGWCAVFDTKSYRLTPIRCSS